jgi:hypothetical protein
MEGQTRILPVDTTLIAPTACENHRYEAACIDLGFPGTPKCRRLRILGTS